MSFPLTPEQHQELYYLIQLLHDEQITQEQVARLEDWVCENEEVSEIYMQYMNMCAQLRWDRRRDAEDSDISLHEESRSSQSLVTPVLGSLRLGTQGVIDFFSNSFVLTLLLAIILPGMVFLVLAFNIARHPTDKMSERTLVAEITKSYETVWGDKHLKLPPGTKLFTGQKLQLDKGLVELTFVDGAKVILEGPTTFQTNSADGGFLNIGTLSATVPLEARGFTIDTPMAKIVDLGTEFGVSVASDGLFETHVFKGKVKVAVRTPSEHQADVQRPRILTAGKAVQITDRGKEKTCLVSTIAMTPTHFVRAMPLAAASITSSKKKSTLNSGTASKEQSAGINIDFQGANTKDFDQLGPIDYVFPNGEAGNYCSLQGLMKKPSRHTTTPKTWSSLVDRSGAKTNVAITILGPDNLVGWAGRVAPPGAMGSAGLSTDYILILPAKNSLDISTDGRYEFAITGLLPSTKYRLGLISGNSIAKRGLKFTFAGGEACEIHNSGVSTTYVTVRSDSKGRITGTVTCTSGTTEGNWGGMTIEPFPNAIRRWNLDIQGDGKSTTSHQDNKPHPHSVDAFGQWNVLNLPAITSSTAPNVTDPSIAMADSTGNRSNPVTLKLIGKIGGWTGGPDENTGDASLRRDYLILKPDGDDSGLPGSIGFELTGLTSGARYALTFIHSSTTQSDRGLKVTADLNCDNNLRDEKPVVITSTLTEKTVQFTANAEGKLVGTLNLLGSASEGNLAGIQLFQLTGDKP